MSFQVTGKIINIGMLESGVSRRTGTQWEKQTFVIEMEDREQHKIPFEIWGHQRIQDNPLEQDALVDVMFDIDGRLFNDRWYTTLSAWLVKPHTEQTAQQQFNDAAEQLAHRFAIR